MTQRTKHLILRIYDLSSVRSIPAPSIRLYSILPRRMYSAVTHHGPTRSD